MSATRLPAASDSVTIRALTSSGHLRRPVGRPVEHALEGQKKAFSHKVGSAFDAKSGLGFDCVILPGVALSGRFIVRPR